MAQWWLNTSSMRSAGWALLSYGGTITDTASIQRASQLQSLSGPLITLLSGDLSTASRRLRTAGTALGNVGRRLGADAEAEERQREAERLFKWTP